MAEPPPRAVPTLDWGADADLTFEVLAPPPGREPPAETAPTEAGPAETPPTALGSTATVDVSAVDGVAEALAARGEARGPARAATAADLPARLATATWTRELDPALDAQRVRVALGTDGAVRLDAARQPDGMAVQIHFTDPELQALAGAHVERLRAALEQHFAEPVRLSLSDGTSDSTSDGGSDQSSAQAGSDRGGAGAGGSDDARPDAASPPGLSQATFTDAFPPPKPIPGRYEWIG